MTRLISDPWQLMRLWQDELNRSPRAPLAQSDDSSVVGGDWTPAIDIKGKRTVMYYMPISPAWNRTRSSSAWKTAC
jgi:hypothetical protein